MNGQVITYGLSIILDNDYSICFPYQILNGRKPIDNLESVRIPSVLCFSNKEITIGNVITDENEKEHVEFVCGFVRAFQGEISSGLFNEMKKKCSCNVEKTSEDTIQYVIKHLYNQAFTPAILLKLFLQFVIKHEESRVGVPMHELYIIYPPTFSNVHVEYLNHLLQSFFQYRLITMNRLTCEIANFLPAPIKELKEPHKVLLFHCDFSTFHIYACSVDQSSIHIKKHAVCTAFSKNGIVNRMRDVVIRQYNKSYNDAIPRSAYRNVYMACSTMLEKLTVQSITSIVIYVDEKRFKCRITDYVLEMMMSSVTKLLTEDMETILNELQWTKESLYSIVVSGDCYNMICYRQWIRQLFPSTIAIFSNDITEYFVEDLQPSLSLVAEELADQSLQVTHTTQACRLLSEDTKLALEEKGVEVEAEVPHNEEMDIQLDEAPTFSFPITFLPEENGLIYYPSDPLQKESSTKLQAMEVETEKTSTTISVTNKMPLRRSTRITHVKKKLVQEDINGVPEDELNSDELASDIEDFETIETVLNENKPRPRKLAKVEVKKERKKRRKPSTEETLPVEKGKKRKTQIDLIVEEAAALTVGEDVQKPRSASLKAIKETKKQLDSQRRKRSVKKESKNQAVVKKETKKGSKKKDLKDVFSYVMPPIPETRIPKDLVIKEMTFMNLSKYRITLLKNARKQNYYSENLCDESFFHPALDALITTKATPFKYKDGSVYEGDVVGGQRHGKGTLTYSNGMIYIGQFKENQRHGKGSIVHESKHIFDGRFENNIPTEGKLVYNNKSCYEGPLNQHGRPHGKGILYANGKDATWDGMWADGKPHGEGTFFYDNGDYYIGELKNGKRSGEGSIHNARGKRLMSCHYEQDLEEGKGYMLLAGRGHMETTFHKGELHGNAVLYDDKDCKVGTGSFTHNKFSGEGVFYVSKDCHYKGTIVDNKYEGEGEYHLDKSICIKGTFEKNNMSGECSLYLDNQMVFKGSISNSVVKGHGCEFYPDGSIMYEGNMTNGLRNGKGKIVFDNRSYYLGNFKYGFVSGVGTVFDKNNNAIITAQFSKGKIIG